METSRSIPRITIILFGVQEVQREGKRVAMVGDGSTMHRLS
jgi:hypothetical protein